MNKMALLAAMALCAQAQIDCSKVATGDNNQCPYLGLSLASLDVLQTCTQEICALLGEWSIAHGSSTSHKIEGAGYGNGVCVVSNWDGVGVGEVVCYPSGGGGGGGDDGGDGGSSSSGMTGGAVFLIIFFVGFAVYFAAGAAYMFKVKGNTGVEIIPHLAFWKELPNLMKDGALFVKHKVTGQGSYESV